MGRFKCNWDRIATPPEEMKRVTKMVIKIIVIFASIPFLICTVILIVFALTKDFENIMMLIMALIVSALIVLPIPLLIWIFAGSGKFHNAVKMQMDHVPISKAEEVMEGFLEEEGIKYLKEKPKGSTYRGYLSHTDTGFYLKKELFIGIGYYYNDTMEKQLRQVTIFYLPSIWEEALFLQKNMDRYFHDAGIAEPAEEGRRLIAF